MQQQSDILTSPLIVVKLEERDTVKSFDCGDEDLNDFILHESPLYRKEKLAVTYVLKEADDLANEHIKAFFSLSNDRISISDFDSKTKYNRFSRRFNNQKRLRRSGDGPTAGAPMRSVRSWRRCSSSPRRWCSCPSPTTGPTTIT